MILSDRDIRRRLEVGDIVIDPLDDPDLQIQPASVDLRLGTEFLTFKSSNIHCIRPERGAEIERYVEKTTVPFSNGAGQQSLREFEGVTEGDLEEAQREFILHPGDFVLGTTKERVEIPPDLIAHVEGRSSLGRLAIVVHASLPAGESVFLWTPEEGFGFHDIGTVVETRRTAHAVAFDPRTLRVGTHPITEYLRRPAKRIYRVTLESGRQVEVTRDHNLFTLDDRGGIDRIPSENAVGRQVAVPRELPSPQLVEEVLELPGRTAGDNVGRSGAPGTTSVAPMASEDPDTARRPPATSDPEGAGTVAASGNTTDSIPGRVPITPELGWVLGLLIGQGSVRGTELRFASLRTDTADRLAEVAAQYDGSIDRGTRDDGTETVTVDSPLLAAIVGEFLDGGAEKAVPERVWNWEDDLLRALLAGMLGGNGRSDALIGTIESGSRSLADRLMYLAARVGVTTTMDLDQDGSTCSVEFRGAARHPSETFPNPAKLLSELRSEANRKRTETAHDVDELSRSELAAVEAGIPSDIARSTVTRLRETYRDAGADTSRVDQLLGGDLRFERVVRVERTDRVEPVYDLEVQPRGRTIENFLAGHGGIFLSNTAGLCDPGYEGQITLELSNLGTAPVALTPDMRIAQLTFTELTSPAERPYGAERGSKYQGQEGPQASRLEHDPEFDDPE